MYFLFRFVRFKPYKRTLLLQLISININNICAYRWLRNLAPKSRKAIDWFPSGSRRSLLGVLFEVLKCMYRAEGIGMLLAQRPLPYFYHLLRQLQ